MRTFVLTNTHLHPQLDYDAFCECTEESRGNFYDFIPRGSSRMAVSFGDLPTFEAPAITVPCIQALVRGLTAGSQDDLADVARELNGTLYLLGPDYLCAPWFYALIDPVRHELRYVNAGHEPPILVRKRDRAVERLERTGAALGLSAREVHRERTIAVEPGDLLAIFSDGLRECLSESRIVRVSQKNPYASAAEITRRVFEEAGGHPLEADRTFAVLRVIGASAHPLMENHSAESLTVCAA